MEELKVINQNLASEMEVYKKKEVETTHLKDEVTKERSLLVERNVRALSLLFRFATASVVKIFSIFGTLTHVFFTTFKISDTIEGVECGD